MLGTAASGCKSSCKKNILVWLVGKKEEAGVGYDMVSSLPILERAGRMLFAFAWAIGEI